MAYQNCHFCHGRGCLACETERQKDAQKPIEPAFIVREDHRENDLALLKDALGRDVLEEEIGLGGNWAGRIDGKLALAKLRQHLRAEDDGSFAALRAEYEAGTIYPGDEG